MNQESQKHIYHCNHCGQLFESVKGAHQNATCTHCGKNPLASPFAKLAQLPEAEPSKEVDNHGVPGKDHADFVSMGKKKRRKNWSLVYATWVIAIIGIAMAGYYIKNVQNKEDTISQLNNEASPKSVEEINLAIRGCYKNFLQFSSAQTIQSKSAHIYNGIELILDLKRYERDEYFVSDLYHSKFSAFRLQDGDGYQKAITTMRYVPLKSENAESKPIEADAETEEISEPTDLTALTDPDKLKEANEATQIDGTEEVAETIEALKETETIGEEENKIDLAVAPETPEEEEQDFYDFEVVFYLVDDEWKIDWQQFVRLGEMHWSLFIKQKQINSPKRFRIYAREIITESGLNDNLIEYKLSQALNNSRIPSQLPHSLFIRPDSTENKQLAEKFEQQRIANREGTSGPKPLLTSFDPPNSLRLDVTLDHQEIDGRNILTIKEIHRFDWQTPPTSSDTSVE